MVVIRQYIEKGREQIIELWKTCDLLALGMTQTKILIEKRGSVKIYLLFLNMKIR